MKMRLLLPALALVLLGAGCFGGDKVDVVEGDWLLAFDLPSDWVMVAPYDQSEGLNLDRKITRNSSEVILQNTEKTVWRGNLPEDTSELPEFEAESYIFVSVTQLDERRIIPSEAVAMEDHFFRFDPCSVAEDCGGANAPTYEYYLEHADRKYKFKLFVKNADSIDGQEVIMSAKRVTPPQE